MSKRVNYKDLEKSLFCILQKDNSGEKTKYELASELHVTMIVLGRLFVMLETRAKRNKIVRKALDRYESEYLKTLARIKSETTLRKK